MLICMYFNILSNDLPTALFFDSLVDFVHVSSGCRTSIVHIERWSPGDLDQLTYLPPLTRDPDTSGRVDLTSVRMIYALSLLL